MVIEYVYFVFIHKIYILYLQLSFTGRKYLNLCQLRLQVTGFRFLFVQKGKLSVNRYSVQGEIYNLNILNVSKLSVRGRSGGRGSNGFHYINHSRTLPLNISNYSPCLQVVLTFNINTEICTLLK